MTLQEQYQELMLMVQKFYARIGTIANEPYLLNEEEAHKLLNESNDIINYINKMPPFPAGPALLMRFESIKNKLLTSMMQSPTNKIMDELGNITEEE